MPNFSILITTKNRIEELKFTLQNISHLILNKDVECIICDDGSTDGTFDFVKENYPAIQLINNEISKGLIYSRNVLLNMTSADYAISLDDDAHFITENPLEIIKNHFKANPSCGVIACRIFWGKEELIEVDTTDNIERVQGFVGCGHIWNLKAWKNIPNYPSWFVFYGEEDFAAFQLYKKNWVVDYLPTIFIQHRVHIKSRKRDKDYRLRLRRSLRSGWYLYFLFYPIKEIPRRFFYTLWIQIKLKVFKGDFKALIAIIQALFDVILNIPRLFKNSNRLTKKEFYEFKKIADTKIYWKP